MCCRHVVLMAEIKYACKILLEKTEGEKKNNFRDVLVYVRILLKSIVSKQYK